MKYIASCSFGKDSLAMLIKIKELGLPLDEVIYCEIMFDNELSGEMPLMAKWIPKAEKILKEQFNIEVKHIRGITFKEQFYTKKIKGKHIGDIYGFPYIIQAWCTDRLKFKPLRQYYRTIDEPIMQYVGIAYNEPTRYKKLNLKNQCAPLYDLQINEDEAFKICEKYDLVSPIYKTSYRGGCWFCVKQRLSQLKFLYWNYPELWAKLKEMEKVSHNNFRADYNLEQLEERFKKEQTTIYDFIDK